MAAAGAKLSAQFRGDLVLVASRYLDSDDNDLKNAAAGNLGAVVRFMTDEELAGVLKNHLFGTGKSSFLVQLSLIRSRDMIQVFPLRLRSDTSTADPVLQHGHWSVFF